MATIPTFDNFIDVGGLWIRYDLIATVKDMPIVGTPRADGEPNVQPYCQVVLTVPGYKTLGVGCTAAELLGVIEETRQSHENEIGHARGLGMIEANRAVPRTRSDG